MRFAQIVMGPAGCGKSTYCSFVEKHAQATKRNISIINLDPAAEHFSYTPVVDIRDLISVEDVMEDEELKLGPNGGLIYCMEYFMEHMDWFYEQIGESDGDYLIFDCPGQIELYTHMNIMKRFVSQLETWSFAVCGIYTIDAHFLTERTKFIAGALTSLSAMVNMEIPHISIITKMDLMSKKDKKRLEMYLEPDAEALLSGEVETEWNKRFLKLTAAIGKILDNYSMVRFYPLDIRKDSMLENLLLLVDQAIGVSEDADVKTKDFEGETTEEVD